MSAETTFNQLPGIAKIVIVIGGTAAIGFIGYNIYRHIQNKAALKGSTEQISAAEDTVKELLKTQKPTLDGLKLSQFSNDLFTAMDGRYSIGGGIDESAIYRAFTNVKNDIDVVNLIKSYGIKKLKSGSFIIPDFQGTLTEALTYALNPEEIKQLNLLLARKGIKYRF
jgi:hypothetical protein